MDSTEHAKYCFDSRLTEVGTTDCLPKVYSIRSCTFCESGVIEGDCVMQLQNQVHKHKITDHVNNGKRSVRI